MKIKKIFSLIFILSLMVTSSLFAIDAQKPQPIPAVATPKIEEQKEKMQILYVHSSASAKIMQHETDTTKLKLILQHVSPNTICFTDHPIRKADLVATDKFVEQWNNGNNSFQQHNPHASLSSDTTAKGANGLSAIDTVILSNPSYDAKHKTLTYDVLANDGKLIHQAGLYRNVVLFLDATPSGE